MKDNNGMKEKYETPEMEVVKFATEDVMDIGDSGDGGFGWEEEEGPW